MTTTKQQNKYPTSTFLFLVVLATISFVVFGLEIEEENNVKSVLHPMEGQQSLDLTDTAHGQRYDDGLNFQLVSRPSKNVVPNVDYGNDHPWEQHHSSARRRTGQLFVNDYKSKQHLTKPIRISFYTDFVEQQMHSTTSTFNHNKEKTSEGAGTTTTTNTTNTDESLITSSSNNIGAVPVTFDTDNIVSSSSSSSSLTAQQIRENKQINVLLEEVLPRASEFWSNALQVIPVQGNLRLNIPVENDDTSNISTTSSNSEKARSHYYSNCPLIEQHSTDGVANTDLMIYVYARTQCSSDSDSTSTSSTTTSSTENVVLGRSSSSGSASTTTFGFPCELDQFDRPIGATLNVCLDLLELNRVGNIPQYIVDNTLTTVIRQMANILGVHPTLYKFFRHALTGQPLTPRPFKDSRVECAGGGGGSSSSSTTNTAIVQMPACNTLKKGQTPNGILYYQVVTPTVVQVMKNHFDCSYVEGARLENQHPMLGDGSSSSKQQQHCLGYEWESRWFEGELMSPMHTSSEHTLSPLTLALLEDSGWYRANYTASNTLAFGHKAGCRFLYEDCIDAQGHVPEYGQDFFCNSLLTNQEFTLSTASRTCDPSHQYKSFCDLVDYNDPYFSTLPSARTPTKKYSYFEQKSLGALGMERDYCPSALRDGAIDCTNLDRAPLVKVSPNEAYGTDSRCFNMVTTEENKSNTTITVPLDPICLQATCDQEQFALVIQVGNDTTVSCGLQDEGAIIPLDDSSNGDSFVCPTLSTACPDLFCFKSCRGRGHCNNKQNVCECFNSEDTTDGCFDTDILGPTMNIESCGDQDTSSATTTTTCFASSKAATIVSILLFVLFGLF